MGNPPNNLEKAAIAVAVVLSLAALALVLLAPGFSFNNTLVYGGF